MLVVRASPEHRPVARALAERLRHALAARGVTVELPAPLETPDLRAPLEEAQRAYYELRPDDATRRLEAWVEGADATGGLGLDRATWIEGLAWLARARLATMDEAGAEAALDRLCAVDPRIELDAATYPPAFRDRAATRCRSREGRALLRVEVRPPNARVFVDGVEMPTAALELPLGLHLVRAEAPGHRGRGRAAEVTPAGGPVELSLVPDPELALAEAGAPGEPIAPLQRAAHATGRALVLVDARREGAGWRLELIDEVDDRRIRAGPERDTERLARALLAGWDVAATTSEPGADEPIDPWPWVAVGAAGAVTVAIGIALGVAFGSAPSGLSAVGMPVP